MNDQIVLLIVSLGMSLGLLLASKVNKNEILRIVIFICFLPFFYVAMSALWEGVSAEQVSLYGNLGNAYFLKWILIFMFLGGAYGAFEGNSHKQANNS